MKVKWRDLAVFGAGILVGVWLFKLIEASRPINTAKTVELTVVEATKSGTPEEGVALYKVIKVIDGDTVQVMVGDKKETVRMIGIDAPEITTTQKSTECFSERSKEKVEKLLTNKVVSLEADSTQSNRDQYNRLLRYIFLEDGTNLNKLLIEQGFARQYTYRSSYKYKKEFVKAEQEAKLNKRGLWASDACAN